MEAPVRNYARTIYEARLDAEFYAIYHARHVRFWRLFRAVIRMVTALAGSSAAAGWLSKNESFAGLAGLTLAFLVALDQALEPAEQLARHKEMARRYRQLAAIQDQDLAAFDTALAAIHADVDAPGFNALRIPSFNDAVIAAGRPDYALPTTRWQRFVSFFA